MVSKAVMRAASLGLAVLCLAVATAAASDDVIHLTTKDFNNDVLRSDEVWLVEFYAPWCGHCKSLAPEWAKAASALKGIVNVAAVDATQEESLAQKYKIQGFPTIKMFGLDKTKPTAYQGARQAKDIAEAGIKLAKSVVKARLGGKKGSASSNKKRRASSGSNASGNDAVVTLDDSNFNDLVMNSKDVWMVEFYAPWCGHCKNLAPEWAKAAAEMQGQVKFGALDATSAQSIASEYGIRGFPTIKVFAPGSSSASDAEEYQGGRTAKDLMAYATHAMTKYGVEIELPELLGDAEWEENCVGRRICMVAVLPHILDSHKDGREAYLKTLKTVATRKASLGFKFLWTSAGMQPDLESKLHLDFGFPALVAVNTGKELYSVHTGAFSETALSTFCESLMSGRASTSPMAGAPKIETVQPWDGKDAQVEEDDEDDDFMAELLAEL